MPLSSNSQFGVTPLTQSINRLPVTPTIIRSLGVFAAKPLTTTYVRVENKSGALRLVKAVPRTAAGEPPARATRSIENFDMLHLPRADVVMADDVQNLRAFGGQNTTTVASVVNDKLADMKADIEMTREYLMLGALQGKIMNADGSSELLNIYDRFGFTRQAHVWDLATQTTKVGEKIDDTMTALKKNLNGEAVNGWICLCSPSFMRALVYHDKIVRIYERYEQSKIYREGETWVDFTHKNIKFIQYDHDFGNGIKIADGEAILLPANSRTTFAEFFSPANYNETVNTMAQPYYAKRVAMKFDKGWDLEAQSNPLPLVLRPELVATIKAA